MNAPTAIEMEKKIEEKSPTPEELASSMVAM